MRKIVEADEEVPKVEEENQNFNPEEGKDKAETKEPKEEDKSTNGD